MTVYIKDLSFGCHSLFLQSKWRPLLLCLLWPWHHPLRHPVYLWSCQGKEPTAWMGSPGTATGLFDEVLIFEVFFCFCFFLNYSRIILGARMGSCNPSNPKCVRCGNRERTVGQMIHLSAWLFCPATGSGSVTRRPGPACWYLGFSSTAAFILSCNNLLKTLSSTVHRDDIFVVVVVCKVSLFPKSAFIAFSAMSSSPAGFALLRWPEDFLLWVLLCWVYDIFFFSAISAGSGAEEGCQKYTYV